MYSTVPPWLRTSPPLFQHTVTGVPGPAFPPIGSKVVSFRAVLQSLFTVRLLSWYLTWYACLHHSLLQAKYSTIIRPCQSLPRRQKTAIFHHFLFHWFTIIKKSGHLGESYINRRVMLTNVTFSTTGCVYNLIPCRYFGAQLT